MVILLITCSIILLSVFCIGVMIWKLVQHPTEQLSPSQYVRLIVSGIIAFVADTLGVGSFAVNVALAKMLGTFSDDEMPAVNNGAQVLPGAIESLYFMHLVDVEIITLLSLIIGTCIGGVIGGLVVSRLSKQAIRLAMIVCFGALIIMLITHQCRVLPMGGDVGELHSWKLVAGFMAMILCGALTSVGIGLFVMVQAVLFLLNVSPLIAFPIMTAAGAMQQPLTTLVFLQKNKIPLKKTLVLSLAGCLGVLLMLPFFKHLTIYWLHTLLLLILIYNLVTISRTYFRFRLQDSLLPQMS